MKPCLFLSLCFVLLSLVAKPSLSQDEAIEAESSAGTAAITSPGQLPNLFSPTLGGTQFWSDELVCRGWRIQRNVLTNHYRLLDNQEYRRAWGSYDECLARYKTFKDENKIEPITGKAVVTLHGLGRSRSAMEGLNKYLAEKGDYTPVNVSYASTRCSIDDHAQNLEKVLSHLDQATQIDFVCHSLGNMVVRRYLARQLEANASSGIDNRFGRMVMLGPPNQGASFAKQFRDTKLMGLLLGPSGKKLASDWETCENQFAVPAFQFGIMAGTKSLNPLLEGTNDIFVTVEETKLAGARDFITFPLMHGQMMNDAKCRECILQFLKVGHFVSDSARQPLDILKPIELAQPENGR